MPKLSVITSFLYLCLILRKKWVMMLISIKALYKLILWFLMGMVKYSQNSQNIKSAMSLQYKLIFCMQINIKVSYKLISTLWTSKFATRWYCHYWWVWLSILKLLKVTSLQYRLNVSKKKLGMEFIYCMQINVKVSTSWHYHFWWKCTQNRKLVIFL